MNPELSRAPHLHRVGALLLTLSSIMVHVLGPELPEPTPNMHLQALPGDISDSEQPPQTQGWQVLCLAWGCRRLGPLNSFMRQMQSISPWTGMLPVSLPCASFDACA